MSMTSQNRSTSRRTPSRVLRGWCLLPGLLACLTAHELPAAESEAPEPQKLVAALVENQRTSGSRTRARLGVESDKGASRSIQVLIKTRQEGAIQETLVVAMWPKEWKGHAWLLRRGDTGDVGGFRFVPPNETTPISRASLDDPLFESDVCIEDFAESFWEWPNPRSAGEEKVDGTACWIIESTNPDPAARHPRVRSWLAKDRPVAMRVEKFGRDGAVAKRITAGRVVRRDEGGWAVAEWIIETLTSGSRTRVVGTRSDRNLVLKAEEFTPDGIRALIDSK